MSKETIENIMNIIKIEYISKINNILDDLNNSFIENESLIVEANKKDIKLSKKKVRVKTLLEIIEKYRNISAPIENNINQKKYVVYIGDPYLTLNICIQSIVNKCKVVLISSDFMSNVNNVIIQKIDEILVKYNMGDYISLYNNYSISEIQKLKNDIIIIGDTNMFELLKTKVDVKFFPYNNIILYTDNKDLEDLKEAIYIVADENKYELEILYDLDIYDVIDTINQNELCNTVILLTKNQSNIEIFKDRIKDKFLYINENPYKEEYGFIYNYFS